jgi:hypothetical protein
MSERNGIGEIIARLAETEEIRAVAGSLVPAVLVQWAGKSRRKQLLIRPVMGIVRRMFAAKSPAEGPTTVLSLFDDGEFMHDLRSVLPSVIGGAVDVLCKMSVNFAERPVEEKEKILSALLEGALRGKTGGMLTSIARALNDIHARDPEFFAKALRPALEKWVANADFGEIKDMIDGSAEDMAAFVRTMNEVLWHYPAKMVCLLSLLPSIANIAVTSAREMLAPINKMAPDLLADVVLSLAREVKVEEIGGVVNEGCELVRKIHTGSALIGEQNSPRLPQDLGQLLQRLFSSIDIPLLLKARKMLSSMGEMSLSAFIGVLSTDPELKKQFFQSHFEGLVAFMRRWSRKADAFENLFTDDEVAEEFSRGMNSIDAQVLADTVNRFCGIVNRVREKTPGTIKTTIAQLFGSLDPVEAGDTVRWLVGDVVESMKPIAPEMMPPVIKGLAELITAGAENGNGAMADAVASLRSALLGKEVAR